jgi:hypothetical protein
MYNRNPRFVMGARPAYPVRYGYGVTEEDFNKRFMGYVRPAGKKLPVLRNGATDASAEAATGIKGLVTEVQFRMWEKMPTAIQTSNVERDKFLTGSLSKEFVQAFQEAVGLGNDGVVGKNTYEKLGFPAPYPGSGGGGGGGGGSTDTTVGDKEPFYKQEWVKWTAGTLGVLGLAYFIIVYPGGD